MTTFSCPHCGQNYEMEDDSRIEGEIRCQSCNGLFTIPPPVAEEEAPSKPKIRIKTPVPETESAPASEPGRAFERPETVVPDVSYGPPAGPWTRWTARLIDFFLENFAANFVLGILQGLQIVPVLPVLLELVICGAAAFLFDSFIYAAFKGTLGKWLMGERVINARCEKINAAAYFIRNIKVFLFGFGAAISLLQLIAGIVQYNRVSKGSPASYDKKTGFSVVEYNQTKYKTVIGVLLLICIILSDIAARIFMIAEKMQK